MNQSAVVDELRALPNAIAEAIRGIEPPHYPEYKAYMPVENGNLPLSTIEIAPKLAAKRSPKAEMVIDWLKSNPDKLSMSNRKIAELLGVTHPTVAEAKKVLGGQHE